MVFTPYPDFLIIYNSQDVTLSQRLTVLPNASPSDSCSRKPEGNFWTTKWTIGQQDETISFEDGWSKFITDNDDPIDGDFLLFSYDGSRTFLVSILRDGLPVTPKSPVSIQEISDEDDDETAGDDDDDDDHDTKEEEEEDNDHNMIISLSLGSSDEDDVDTTVGEVNKAHERSRRVTSSQRKRAEAIGDPAMYLDDPSNAYFIATSTCACSVLVLPKQVRKYYDLKFDGTVKFIDGFGELERTIINRKDRVVVHKWKEVYERNDATPEDVIICVILHEGGVVRSIKAHFVKK